MNKGLYCLILFNIIVLQTIAQTPVLTRGPYLQMATTASMNVRWRTDLQTISRIRYGASLGALNGLVENTTLTTEHELKITGLSPITKYWYSIESSSGILQGDADNYFTTLPVVGTQQLYRIGVFGDCGNNSTNQLNVRNQMISYLGSNYMNAWLLLGDNAYPNGLDADYSAGFFNMYKDKFLKQNPLFPCPGNHDYNAPNSQNTHIATYYNSFTMPTAAESGGYASGSEAFYSFDIGNIHFISLDSYGKENNSTRLYDTLGSQVQWLKQDLDNNANKQWVIAYWHHPPFTKGSHDSDIETELVQIRTNFIKILERYGVDLVLCGHSHDYERTRLQKGFYDVEANFNPSVHNLSSSSGRYNGTANACPYYKSAANNNQGTVYVVSGSAGQLGGTTSGSPHNAMCFSDADNGGSMILEIEGNRLDAKWICADGDIRDQFTMMKNVNQNNTYHVTVGSPVTLQASYKGNYTWTTNETTASITVTPAAEGEQTYIVKDDYSCVADSFKVIASSLLPVVWGNIKVQYDKNEKANKLQWQTLHETTNDFFEIERSTNGSQYTALAKVPSSDNNDIVQNYTYLDKTLLPDAKKYYYRVKQVDVNGDVTYSPIVTINANTIATGFDIKIIPNPGKAGEMKVQLSSVSTLPLSVKLLNSVGKAFMNKQLLLNQNAQLILPYIAHGSYFLSVAGSNQVITKQVIVQ